jgi:hypothetical protein
MKEEDLEVLLARNTLQNSKIGWGAIHLRSLLCRENVNGSYKLLFPDGSSLEDIMSSLVSSHEFGYGYGGLQSGVGSKKLTVDWEVLEALVAEVEADDEKERLRCEQLAREESLLQSSGGIADLPMASLRMSGPSLMPSQPLQPLQSSSPTPSPTNPIESQKAALLRFAMEVDRMDGIKRNTSALASYMDSVLAPSEQQQQSQQKQQVPSCPNTSESKTATATLSSVEMSPALSLSSSLASGEAGGSISSTPSYTPTNSPPTPTASILNTLTNNNTDTTLLSSPNMHISRTPSTGNTTSPPSMSPYLRNQHQLSMPLHLQQSSPVLSSRTLPSTANGGHSQPNNMIPSQPHPAFPLPFAHNMNSSSMNNPLGSPVLQNPTSPNLMSSGIGMGSMNAPILPKWMTGAVSSSSFSGNSKGKLHYIWSNR